MFLESGDFEQRLAAGLGSWPAGAVFLAALSGGADSTALTAGLAALRDGGAAFSFCCLHVNHNIRSPGECAGDEIAVTALCASLAVPLRIRRAEPGAIASCSRSRGIEAAARRFRMAALRDEARRAGACAILTGHTRDDLLENILMAVLRGSGPAGLGAWRREKHIFERGTGAEPRIPVIRPLVTFHREEVIAYLRARELSWREDSSNTDTRFFRNRVRRVLIPLLDREFPGWKSPLLRLNETQAMTADFLDSRARHTLPWRGNTNILSVDEAAFFAQSPVIREEALFAALDALGEERPRRAALRPFAGGARHTLDLGYARLERGGGLVSVKRASVVKGERGFSLLIKCPGFYKLEQQAEQSVSAGLVLEARAGGGAGNAANGEFRVFLPFVLRALSGGQRLEARDKAGQAALFDARGVSVWKRNGEGDAAARLEAARRVARE